MATRDAQARRREEQPEATPDGLLDALTWEDANKLLAEALSLSRGERHAEAYRTCGRAADFFKGMADSSRLQKWNGIYWSEVIFGNIALAAGNREFARASYGRALYLIETLAGLLSAGYFMSDDLRQQWNSTLQTEVKIDALISSNFEVHGESNSDVDAGIHPRDDPDIVDTAEAIEAARAILSRVPPAERTIVVKALEENLTGGAAGGESAGTDDLATGEPRQHWKEAAQAAEDAGASVPQLLEAFITREFASELADGTMMRPLLNRYDGLYQDYCNHRHQLPPELQRIPKKGDFNDRLVAEGKVTTVTPDSVRSAVRPVERDRKRVARAQRRTSAAT
jgi:hypothetical protein